VQRSVQGCTRIHADCLHLNTRRNCGWPTFGNTDKIDRKGLLVDPEAGGLQGIIDDNLKSVPFQVRREITDRFPPSGMHPFLNVHAKFPKALTWVQSPLKGRSPVHARVDAVPDKNGCIQCLPIFLGVFHRGHVGKPKMAGEEMRILERKLIALAEVGDVVRHDATFPNISAQLAQYVFMARFDILDADGRLVRRGVDAIAQRQAPSAQVTAAKFSVDSIVGTWGSLYAAAWVARTP
jgi:hypothetical protein